MKEVDLYTDGACCGNPGPGGWCAILKYKTAQKVISGSEKDTTNNRMELTAVIEGLKVLKEPCKVNCFTDSAYICNAINKKWIDSWQARGWKRGEKKPVLNPDLWQEIVKLTTLHDVTFNWIKGHNGQPENEMCDRVAVSEYQKYLK